MFTSSRRSFIALLIPASVVFADPTIEFDTRTFNCGIAVEGKTDTLHAVFIAKNTGDKELKLESVRPGCGCTVVKYDSLIAPGKTGTINARVNIKGYHAGPIIKAITVTSNAKNDPSIHLSIEATVQPLIDVATNFLSLSAVNAQTPLTIHLASKKEDLKVTEMAFKSTDNSGKAAWQSDLPLPIKFNFNKTDSVRADKLKDYKLSVYAPTVQKTVSGEFTIKTNHPEKPEISLRGELVK